MVGVQKRTIRWAISLLLVMLYFSGLTAQAQYGGPTQPEEMLERSSLHMVGQVGGPIEAVAVQGNYAYVGVGLRLVVLDISDPAALSEVGATTPFPYFVESVVLSGTLAYVAAGAGGLRVVDISDPAHPVEIGTWDSPGYTEEVSVAGSIVYLADGPFGLRVVDVANPAHPVEVGYAYPLNYVFDVTVDGQYAYLAAAGAGLLVVDVSDPANPIETGTYDTLGYAFSVDVAGDVAYVADGWEGLRIVNVSNPEQPVEVGSYKTPGWAFGVVVEGSIAYVADVSKGLRVVDVTSPSSPEEIGAYEVKGKAGAYEVIGEVVVVGDKVYVADRNNGLRIIDISNQSSPTEIGFYSPLGYADAIEVSGNYAYVAAGHYGLRIVDISNPAKAREVGWYNTAAFANAVSVVGNYAYVTTMWSETDGLYIVDISNPNDPTGVSYFQPPGGGGRDLVVSGGIAYYTDEGGLLLIDITDPLNPFQTGYIQLKEGVTGGETESVDVSDTLAYVTQPEGIKIVDVSNPQSPALIGVFQTGSRFNDVYVVEDRAYAVTSSYELIVLDVSNPASPNVIGYFETHAGIGGVTVDGSIAYLAIAQGGVVVVDVSDPFSPTFVAEYNTPGAPRRVVADDKRVYVADGKTGLLILEMVEGQTETVGRAWGEPAPPVAAPGDGTPGRPPMSRLGRRTSPVYHDKHTPDPIHRQLPQPQPDVRLTAGPPRISNTCVVTSTADSGSGSLRWCLENAQQGDIITFSTVTFPPDNPGTISLTSALPHITQGNITIDASDAGVVVTGEKISGDVSGFQIKSNGNIIKGLQILFFPENGVQFLGSENIIGGDRGVGDGPIGEGNVISGNVRHGIVGSGYSNTVIGNLIGTDFTGTRDLGNGRNGIDLAGLNIRVGGDGPISQRNVMSGNGRDGMRIFGVNNTVIGNLIGTDVTGTKKLGNGRNGIVIGGQNNRIGGDGPISQRNVISGNGSQGMKIVGNNNTVIGNLIGTDVTGTKELGNAGFGICIAGQNNRIGGTESWEKNIISGNGIDGIRISKDGNSIVGNYIGTDISGSSAIGNYVTGIDFQGGAFNNIVKNNLVSGNADNGMNVSDSCNIVIGNIVGLDASGTMALGSRQNINVSGSFNRVGGMSAVERNITNGTVDVSGYNQIIIGNYIGTDATGTRPVGNNVYGIECGGEHNFIGGTTAEERNVISGNGGEGIIVWDNYNFVAGNYVGTDVSGTTALGNSSDGVSFLRYAEHNVIQCNLLSGNEERGVSIHARASSNILRANRVGVAADGVSPLPNGTGGVSIRAASNTVGGPYPEDGNIIAFNIGDGIQVWKYPGNTIRRNSIYSNSHAGIDLADGGNNLLAAPVIADVLPGSVSGTACPGCIVEIFSDEEDEGKVYEGSVTADGQGNWTWIGSPTGPYVTATATDGTGNTSPFSSRQMALWYLIYLPLILR